jgi:hypothetical protein
VRGLSRRDFLRSSDERGSILLITLVSVAVMALLGLAVYDLALIEAKFSAASVIDYRAYEIAQAGIERGIRELRNLYMSYPPGQETFVAGSTTCAPTPCDTTQFHPANLTNTTVPLQEITAGQFQGAKDPGGSYTLELKYLTIAEANNSIDAVGLPYPAGLQCFRDNVFTTWCANLAFLRSTGTTTDGAGNTRTRTIQTLVRAASTSPWASGIVAGPGNTVVSGQVLIAGSIHVLGDTTSNPAVNISGGGDAGMVNSWYPLTSGSAYSQSEPEDVKLGHSLRRLTPKQLICPPGAICIGGANLVESLGAEIKIFGNIRNTKFATGSSTGLGQTTSSTPLYGSPPPAVAPALARSGKGPLDGVYIAAGCSLPCMGSAPQPFNSGASVIVDRGNLTKPYPNNPPIGPLLTPSGAWPVLNDVVTISNNVTGTDYTQFFSQWFNPNVAGGVNTASFTSGQTPNGGNCATPADDECVGKPGPNTFNDLFNKLTVNTKSFRHKFKFTDRITQLRDAEICWRRDEMIGPGNRGVSPPANPTNPGAPAYTLEFGIPACDTPSGPGNAVAPNIPVMFWYGGNPNPWGVDYLGSPNLHADISFRGWALMVTNSNVIIDENFRPYCDNPGQVPPCGPVFPVAGWQGGNKFPENHLFAVMTTNGIDLTMNQENVKRIFGYFFAMGNIRVRRDVNVVGMLRGSNICFMNACGVPVGNGATIPGFFQASFLDHRKIPNELAAPYEVPGRLSGGRWQVTSVPQFWIECRPSPSGALPPTPGICRYDQ